MLLTLPPALLLRTPPSLPAREDEIAPPEGWKRVAMKGGQTAFAPEDVPKGKIAGIVLWPEERAPGDLKAWFARRAAEFGVAKPDVKGDARTVLTGGEANGRPLILAAVRLPGSGERARVAMLFADADLLKEYGPTFGALLASLRGDAPKAERTPKAEPSPRDRALAKLPLSDPAKPLPPAALNGAKIFIRNTSRYGMSGMEVRTDPLILFPDGTAFDGGPSYPVAAFDPAHLKEQSTRFDVGTWRIEGATMTLLWPAKAPRDREQTYRRIGDAWTDSKDATKDSTWNVYRRVVPLPPAKILGPWHSSSLMVTGTMGGGTPMVSSGSSSDLAFNATEYADASSSFASATTTNMGDGFKSGGDVTTFSDGKRRAAGRYRLDGLLLTRERNGRRGVELAFLIPSFDGPDPKTMWLSGDRWSRPEGK